MPQAILPPTAPGPAPPCQRNPGVPAELSELVMEMLAKSPQARPASAREVREALLALRRPPASSGRRKA